MKACSDEQRVLHPMRGRGATCCLFWIATLVGVAASPPKVVAAPPSFIHPGVGVGLERLEYVKAHLGQDPWKSAYERVLQDPRADLSYRPVPWAVVECGPYSKPDHGCKDETRDSQAAYTQALLWFFSGDPRYAKNAKLIMNSWATTLVGGHTNKNAPLQAAWSAQSFARAAEIISHTGGGWSNQDRVAFSAFLRRQYLPSVERIVSGTNSCYNGNWHASSIQAMMDISILSEDRGLFDRATTLWRDFLPSYVYLESDGTSPKASPWCKKAQESAARWHQPKSFVDGLTQETCRDFEHTAYGLAAIMNVAESARLQGVNLYQDEASQAERRISKAMELHSAQQNHANGKKDLCSAYAGFKGNTLGTFGNGFNYYNGRGVAKLPQTQLFVTRSRSARGSFHYLWEALISASPEE